MVAMRDHHYAVTTTWTGNLGTGTASYRGYSRHHDVAFAGKPALPGSSDPTFRGDATRYNPEELLLSALSQCHLLSYLHVCVSNGIVVTAYTDAATGTMITNADGSGAFSEVVLHPQVTISVGDPALAERLHDDAHRLCFIANSVSFPVRHEPELISAS